MLYHKEFFLGKKLMFPKSYLSLLNPQKKTNMKYTCKRHTYDVKENNMRLLRIILKPDVCGDIGLITLCYLKSYLVWVFSWKLLQCFPLSLTLEQIRSRGSTSSAEQYYIVTIYYFSKDCILAYKIGNQIHTIKFKERKVPQYNFAQKMAALRYMFCAIFAPNSVGKILQKFPFEVVHF